MKKTMFVAALFVFAFNSAHAFYPGDSAEIGTASAQAEEGAALKVGKFLGTMLKAPVNAGRDVMTGFKAGFAGTSQQASAETATHGGVTASGHATASATSPNGLQTFVKDRLASVRKSFATSCKSCASGSSTGSESSASSGKTSMSGSVGGGSAASQFGRSSTETLSVSAFSSKAGF